jgi:NAD(P)-dependent dehydrogenase (short-subunit alcohol dehydrogenase family)
LHQALRQARLLQLVKPPLQRAATVVATPGQATYSVLGSRWSAVGLATSAPFANASIVLNGSINARIGMPNASVYAASKAALISLAKNLSAELLPRGIRVNVVSPGPVQTPLYGKLGLDAATLDATAAAILGQIPLGRFGTSEEIASTVLHLSAAESAFIVGTEIIVDGGMSQL